MLQSEHSALSYICRLMYNEDIHLFVDWPFDLFFFFFFYWCVVCFFNGLRLMLYLYQSYNSIQDVPPSSLGVIELLETNNLRSGKKQWTGAYVWVRLLCRRQQPGCVKLYIWLVMAPVWELSNSTLYVTSKVQNCTFQELYALFCTVHEMNFSVSGKCEERSM